MISLTFSYKLVVLIKVLTYGGDKEIELVPSELLTLTLSNRLVVLIKVLTYGGDIEE